MKVFVFSGGRNPHPSGVFSSTDKALEWIRRHKLSGTLTEYIIDHPPYEWMQDLHGYKPEGDTETSAPFIANYSHAKQKHYHFEHGDSYEFPLP